MLTHRTYLIWTSLQSARIARESCLLECKWNQESMLNSFFFATGKPGHPIGNFHRCSTLFRICCTFQQAIARDQAWRNEFRGGGTRLWGPLRKRAPSAKRAHKVYAKITNCLKTAQSQKSPFLEISGHPRSLPRDKIYGARGGPVPPPFLQPCPRYVFCHLRQCREFGTSLWHFGTKRRGSPRKKKQRTARDEFACHMRSRSQHILPGAGALEYFARSRSRSRQKRAAPAPKEVCKIRQN